jgi:hypothetical protein
MADGGLTVELDEALGARLRAAANAAGRPIETFVAELIAEGLDDDWAESYARYAEYRKTSDYLDAEAELKVFRQAVAARFEPQNR